jgi:hypothetical protein
MKRIVQLEIDRCFWCHYREESGGLAGSADWCIHPALGKPTQICGEELERDFPSWCPLKTEE